MSVIWNSLAIFLVVIGLLTMLVGSIGIIRLPDFFTRTHAASMVDTTGIILLLVGLAIYESGMLSSGKLLLAIGFVAMTNPVAGHALARAALRMGVKPWRPGGRNGKETNELED